MCVSQQGDWLEVQFAQGEEALRRQCHQTISDLLLVSLQTIKHTQDNLLRHDMSNVPRTFSSPFLDAASSTEMTARSE